MIRIYKRRVKDSMPVVSSFVLSPEELSLAIRSADLEPCQLSGKPATSRLSRVICPSLCLDFADLGPALLFTGIMPARAYTLIYIRRCPEPGHAFNFGVDHVDGFIGFFPPGGPVDAYTPEGYANATITVAEADFERAVTLAFPEITAAVLRTGAAVQIPARERYPLDCLVRAVEESMVDPEQPLGAETARRHVEGALLDAFLTALRSGLGPGSARLRSQSRGRMKHLRTAREFIRENASRSFDVTDLCSSLGMSRRGIELLFRDTLGVAPGAYVKHQRLHGARRALLEAENRAGAVKEAALCWGFWHMGHFARNYRELFGESPSQTAAR